MAISVNAKIFDRMQQNCVQTLKANTGNQTNVLALAVI